NAANFKGWAHMTCRGVTYHDDAAYASEQSPTGTANAPVTSVCPRRIFLPTADTRLIALNADTGKMCEDFGNGGQVDLTTNIGEFTAGGYYSTSPPAVTKDLVVI
ncbi:hypothetical protein ACS73_29985, partial [Pseudomonas lini]